MSEAAIHDYLTKQIIINHNIITFRLLSRAVSIHVNAAKSALASFYETQKASSSDSALHATYLISGDAAETIQREDSMEVDSVQVDAPSPMAETVPTQKMMVVPEEKLEAVKSLFKSIRATHIYSVEPSKFMDPSLLVTTVDAVRKVDATKSAGDLRKLGIPVSNACKRNANIKNRGKPAATTQPKASASKDAAKNMKAPAIVPKKPSIEKVKPEPKSDPPAKKEVPKGNLANKPSQIGALDWGKAKAKEPTKVLPEKVKARQKITVSSTQTKRAVTEREPSVSSSTTSDPKPKRGIKRPTPPSDGEEDEDMRPPKAKARMSAPSKVDAIRTKRGVVLSDDDEEEAPVKSVRRKTKSDATMDWSDDDNVVTAPRHIPGPPSSRGAGTENDEDDEEPEQSSLGEDPMEMSDSPMEEPKYAKNTRVTKKSKKWPVGANGLRKRRVVLTREFTDARGFLQMEDYSEYESVNSESEQPPDPAAKTKRAPKEIRTKAEPVEKKEPATKIVKQSSFKEGMAPKPKPKQAFTGATKKKTLDSFFQKK